MCGSASTSKRLEILLHMRLLICDLDRHCYALCFTPYETMQTKQAHLAVRTGTEQSLVILPCGMHAGMHHRSVRL